MLGRRRPRRPWARSACSSWRSRCPWRAAARAAQPAAGPRRPQGSVPRGPVRLRAYAVARLLRADHVASFGQELWVLIKVFAYPASGRPRVAALHRARALRAPAVAAHARLLEAAARGQLSRPAGRPRRPAGRRAPRVDGGAVRLSSWRPARLGRGARPAPGRFVTGATLAHAGSGRLPAAREPVQRGALRVFLFILVLLRMLLRSGVLAALALGARRGRPHPGGRPAVSPGSPSGLRAARVLPGAHARRAAAASSATLFSLFTLVEAPLTLDVSAWYLSRSVPQLLTIAGAGRSTASGPGARGQAGVRPPNRGLASR